jgi:hypothetical protein
MFGCVISPRPACVGSRLRCGALSNVNAKRDFAARECAKMPDFIGEN